MDAEVNTVSEITLQSIGLSGAYVYGGVSTILLVILLISTMTTCSKTHFVGSLLLALVIALFPAIVHIGSKLVQKYYPTLTPLANTFKMMGVSPERSDTFAGIYLILLVILPLAVYAIHSAEQSACVATPDEMGSFKAKMLAELQQKQEAEEKNEKKK
jgi:hypothetical protein